MSVHISSHSIVDTSGLPLLPSTVLSDLDGAVELVATFRESVDSHNIVLDSTYQRVKRLQEEHGLLYDTSFCSPCLEVNCSSSNKTNSVFSDKFAVSCVFNCLTLCRVDSCSTCIPLAGVGGLVRLSMGMSCLGLLSPVVDGDDDVTLQSMGSR